MGGGIANPGTIDAAALSTTYASLVTRVEALEARPRTLGDGQSWQDMTSSRASNTTYTNSTGKPIQLSIVSGYATSQSLSVVVSGVTAYSTSTALAGGNTNLVSALGLVVPPGATYSAIVTAGFTWKELR